MPAFSFRAKATILSFILFGFVLLNLLGSFKSISSHQRSLLQEYWLEASNSVLPWTTDTPNKPLNIVLLYADDWRHDALGVANTIPVQTPFLDWLSTHKGIRFTHNCVVTSVCWISRVTLHMGQYLSRHGAAKVMNNTWYQNFNNSFVAGLKDAGYYLAHIGKWHTANFELIQHFWDYSNIYYGRHFFPGTPKPIHVTQRNQQDAIQVIQTSFTVQAGRRLESHDATEKTRNLRGNRR